ncbi:hypothetical protein LC607_23975 [Nostoc sp. CHAB 5824]|nr:hypothetical protein [Nostoc sp. CHAB 5824]
MSSNKPSGFGSLQSTGTAIAQRLVEKTATPSLLRINANRLYFPTTPRVNLLHQAYDPSTKSL